MTLPNDRLTLTQIAAQCGNDMPLPVASDQGTVFAEPWQAHAFAMTVALHERGLFSWKEWAAALSQQIGLAIAAGDADDGSGYYRHWLNALEALIIERRLASAEQIHELEHAWEDAAQRTPHGQPIVLAPAVLAELANT